MEIVGLVEDAKYDELREDSRPMLFVALSSIRLESSGD